MRSLVVGLILAGAVAARADGPINLSVRGKGSLVTYHIIHKFHRVDGVSRSVDGRARITPGGPTQVMIRVPVESFDSGNVNRDAHMKEVTEAAKYPDVEVKAVAEGIAVPATFPTTIDKTMKAQVTFHGVTQPLEVPVKVTFTAPASVTATASFGLSLDAFKVERPSLMFVRVDDELKIDATIVMGQ